MILFKPFRVAYYLVLRICKFLQYRLHLLKYKCFGHPLKKVETAKAS